MYSIQIDSLYRNFSVHFFQFSMDKAGARSLEYPKYCGFDRQSALTKTVEYFASTGSIPNSRIKDTLWSQMKVFNVKLSGILGVDKFLQH